MPFVFVWAAEVCGFCRKPVALSEPAIEALNRTYHDSCFQCRCCHCPLAGKQYYNKAGIPLCTDCYQVKSTQPQLWLLNTTQASDKCPWFVLMQLFENSVFVLFSYCFLLNRGNHIFSFLSVELNFWDPVFLERFSYWVYGCSMQ